MVFVLIQDPKNAQKVRTKFLLVMVVTIVNKNTALSARSMEFDQTNFYLFK